MVGGASNLPQTVSESIFIPPLAGPAPVKSSKSNFLNVYFSNCRSICNKLEELHILLSSQS